MLKAWQWRLFGVFLACCLPAVSLAAPRALVAPYAELGGTAVVLADGRVNTTLSRFYAQLSGAGALLAGGRVSNNQPVDVTAWINVPASLVGQTADILLVASYQGAWYMKTPQGWRVWDQQLASLAAFASRQLVASNEVAVESQLALPGSFSIYMGYRLQGEVVYSPVPLNFTWLPALADVAVKQFALSSYTPASGDLLTLTVAVINKGEVPANTVLRYYQSYDTIIAHSVGEVCTDTVTLQSGAVAEWHCQTTAPPTNTYYYRVCLDVLANESNTADNCSAVSRVDTGAPQEGRVIPLQPIAAPSSPGLTLCSSPLIVKPGGGCVQPVNQPEVTHRLNDTGITRCASAGENGFACPLAGFLGQDAEAGRDQALNDGSDGHAGFSFTKLSATGQILAASATQWSCVKDNVTGLIWEVKTDNNGLHDKDWTYTWYQGDNRKNAGVAGVQNGGDCGGTSACDTQAYVQAVNAAGWCGAKDWRMPSVDELAGLAALDRINPAIDTTYFPNTLPRAYWTASPAGLSDYVWYVYFDHGLFSWHLKGEKSLVRLVRGG